MIFHTVGLIGKYRDPNVAPTLLGVAEMLRSQGIQVLLDESTSEAVTGHDLEVVTRDAIGERCELAIVIGGDGTLLNAARSLADAAVPLLGINLGRLGFLVDVSKDSFAEALNPILRGEYLEEERFLLQTAVIRDGEHISDFNALNDVVIHKLDVARMIEFDTLVNGSLLHKLRSDGLIVSTPTGSTAYALSGGGPIIEPGLDAIVLVPICPHTLSNRPIVVGADSEIEIVLGQIGAQLTGDGQINVVLSPGDHIYVRRKQPMIRTIHPSAYSYFGILREKLYWSR